MGFFSRRSQPTRGQNLAPEAAQTVVEQRAECAICFEPLAGTAGNPVCRLVSHGRSCGHYVHKSCAERWRDAASAVCPVCRQPFSALRTFPPIDNAREWFAAVDADGNNRLDQREVAAALKATVTDLDAERLDREIPSLWRRWDKNGDGSLTFDELFAPGGLVAYVRGAYRGHREDGEPPPLSDARAWFSFWDYDGSNTLDKAEVHRALVKTFGLQGMHGRIDTMRETLDAVWVIFDHDGSGDVDRVEYASRGGLGETLAASLNGFERPRPVQATHYAPPPVLEATVVSAAPPAYADAPPSYLPPGWEERASPDGRAYFIDHNTQQTQWHRPT